MFSNVDRLGSIAMNNNTHNTKVLVDLQMALTAVLSFLDIAPSEMILGIK